MSSEIHAQLWSSRRATDRAGVNRASTIRQDDALRPLDVIIGDLSSGGCRVLGEPLPLGEHVTIGLPGVGARPAQVVWTRDGSNGLAFHHPLTGEDIDIAREADTLVAGYFGPTIGGEALAAAHGASLATSMFPDADADILSGRRRIGIIVGATIGFWGVALIVASVLSRII